jgi:DnaK suppressor protein
METVRRRLQRELSATVRRLRQLGGAEAIEELPTGLGSVFEDADRVQVEQSQEIGLLTKSRLAERVKRISEALRRIETGDYGMCTECGEPISPKRLRALPEVQTCVTCQERIERITGSTLARGA